MAIGDIDAVIDAVFFNAPDVGSGLALAVGAQQGGQATLLQGASADILAQNFRQQVGGIHQGFLG